MKTQNIGSSTLVSTRLAYGCWRVAGADDPRDVTEATMLSGRRAIAAAYEAGYTLFDTADIYCRGMCETVLGMALRDIPAMRKGILIATKCGIRFAGEPNPDSPQRYDFSAEHILWSAEQSLKRMGIETIDLYQLHRPDVLMDPHEVAGAFEQLRRQGKVREFGVSNFTPSYVDLLAKSCPMPLIVNQVEIHLGRLDCFNDGTLDQCIRQSMTPLSWSPLGGGWIAAGKVASNDPQRARKQGLIDTLDQIAAARGTSRTVVALAWLLKHPSRILPIIGSVNPGNIRDAVAADGIDLTRDEWYRLLIAARGERLP